MGTIGKDGVLAAPGIAMGGVDVGPSMGLSISLDANGERGRVSVGWARPGGGKFDTVAEERGEGAGERFAKGSSSRR
jgi:hypothetical protein